MQSACDEVSVCAYIYIYIYNSNYKMDIVKCLTPFLHKNKHEKPLPIVCCYFITWVNKKRSSLIYESKFSKDGV